MDANLLKQQYERGDRDFQGSQLSGTDLSWLTLSHSNLSGSDCYGANLSGTNLEGVDFSGTTNLSFANFSRANLANANLTGANLTGANLDEANLTDALYDEYTQFPLGFDPVAKQMMKQLPQVAPLPQTVAPLAATVPPKPPTPLEHNVQLEPTAARPDLPKPTPPEVTVQQQPQPQSKILPFLAAGSIIGASILVGFYILAQRTPPEVGLNRDVLPPSAPEPIAPEPSLVSPVIPELSPDPPVRRVIDTNASVSGIPGQKNMRSGPGTIYGVIATVTVGDRVQILNQGSDRGGYVWYEVYVPQTGGKGWIAAQLINPD